MLVFLNTIGALQLFTEPQILEYFQQGAISVNYTPSYYIWNRPSPADETNLAAAMAVILAVIIVVISALSLIVRRAQGRVRMTVTTAPPAVRRRRRRRRRPSPAASAGGGSGSPRATARSPSSCTGCARGTVTLLTTLAFLFAIFTLIPIVWILINSTKTQANIFETFGFWFASPFEFFHTFGLLFQNVDGYGTFIQWFGNTALYAALGGGGATAPVRASPATGSPASSSAAPGSSSP